MNKTKGTTKASNLTEAFLTTASRAELFLPSRSKIVGAQFQTYPKMDAKDISWQEGRQAGRSFDKNHSYELGKWMKPEGNINKILE